MTASSRKIHNPAALFPSRAPGSRPRQRLHHLAGQAGRVSPAPRFAVNHLDPLGLAPAHEQVQQLSSEEQGRGYSLPTQLESCRGHAEKCGDEVVAEFTDMYSWLVVDGMSSYAIAKALFDNEILSKGDISPVVVKKEGPGSWSPSTVRQMLSSSVYKGIWYYSQVEETTGGMVSRLEAIEEAVEDIDRKLSALLDEVLAGSFNRSVIEAKQKQLAEHRASLLTEAQRIRDELEMAIITPDQEEELMRFAGELRDTLEDAAFEDKRRILELIKLRVDVISRTQVKLSGVISPEGSFADVSCWWAP